MNKKIIITSEKKGNTISKNNKTKTSDKREIHFAFGKTNYYLMIIGIFIIVIGFLLMTGGGSKNPDIFNEKEIFSFRRITLSPILILTGYIIEVFAILYKPKN